MSEEERKQILHTNWKERLAGLQAASQVCTVLSVWLLFRSKFLKLFYLFTEPVVLSF